MENFKYQSPVISNNLIKVKRQENMEKNIPKKIGYRFSVIAYVDSPTFSKIEELRGDIARSKFLGKIIQNSITQGSRNHHEPQNPGTHTV